MYAYCCLREDYRLFKLTRIKELRVTTHDYKRFAPSQLSEMLNPQKEKTISIALLFDKEITFRVYDYFDEVTEREDGSYIAKADLPYNEWLYSFLLSYGDKVEVIAPQFIREERLVFSIRWHIQLK